MKVFAVMHWYDFEDSNILKLYSTLELAQEHLKRRHSEFMEDYNYARAEAPNLKHEKPVIDLVQNYVEYGGSNYSIREYTVDGSED